MAHEWSCCPLLKENWMRATLVLSASLIAACNTNSIGRPCVNPNGQAVMGIQFASPALECPSRICMIEPDRASSGDLTQATDGGVFRAICTATCNSDSDCSPESNDYCKSSTGTPLGFVCAVATSVGPFCCKKVCMCRGDLDPMFNQDVDGGATLPSACDPARDNPITCPNVRRP
jgi:hypothetical protein